MSEASRIATQARLLYGLELTPEVVWNLAPWSWLVDWVTNVGSVLHNVSAFQSDGLVMPYAYVMDQSFHKTERVIGPFHVFPDITQKGVQYRSIVTKVERKTRIKASPFGISLIESQFTNRQWAILAALGITRKH
jgi:hypothetical protein